MHTLRSVTFIVVGLVVTVSAHAQLEWFITPGPGNVQAGISETAGSGYADRLNGRNVVIDHQSTIAQGPNGVSGQYLKNFSVWIRNTGTSAVSTVGSVTSNTLVGIDRSDATGFGRTQCLLPVGTTGNFAGNPADYGAWGANSMIGGPASNVSLAPGSGGGTLNPLAFRPWGYYVSLNNTVSFSIAAGADVRLFNFTVRNNTLGNGGSTAANPCPICIWDAGTGTGNTTVFRQLASTTNYRPGGNTTNSTGNNNAQGSYACFNIVPEPGTTLAIAVGLGALGTRRRRK